MPAAATLTAIPDAKSAVLALHRAFGVQDKAAIADLFHPDARWIVPPNNASVIAMGHTAGWNGREEILDDLTESVAGRYFSESQVEILTLIGEGENAMIEQLYTGRVNGRPYKMVQVFIYHVEAGQIREVRAYFGKPRTISMK